MLGYYKDPEATAAARRTAGSAPATSACCTRTATWSCATARKDVIISGGENIASVEVEQALADHPAVLEVAVVGGARREVGRGRRSPTSPCSAGARGHRGGAHEHVRARLARFKAPEAVVFGELPKTSTGKIQKFVLREQAWADGERIGRI